VRHHELVLEAAIEICDGLRGQGFEREVVLVGAALHDAGKAVHPEEMSAPGDKHEQAGRTHPLARGVPESLARFCVTHASWDAPGCVLEDCLVALADKLWKGKRDGALERTLVNEIAVVTKQQPWTVFVYFDQLCEAVAAAGADRLARSAV
jgi:hypothetical protein